MAWKVRLHNVNRSRASWPSACWRAAAAAAAAVASQTVSRLAGSICLREIRLPDADPKSPASEARRARRRRRDRGEHQACELSAIDSAASRLRLGLVVVVVVCWPSRLATSRATTFSLLAGQTSVAVAGTASSGEIYLPPAIEHLLAGALVRRRPARYSDQQASKLAAWPTKRPADHLHLARRDSGFVSNLTAR